MATEARPGQSEDKCPMCERSYHHCYSGSCDSGNRRDITNLMASSQSRILPSELLVTAPFRHELYRSHHSHPAQPTPSPPDE